MIRRCPNRSSVRGVKCIPRHVTTWGCMPWWWWNTGCIHASHSGCTSSLPHWTHPSHPSSGSSVPLPLRSFHPVIEPIIYCFHRFWGDSPSWCASYSSIPCTCFYPRCDNTWVHIRERNRSHLTSVFGDFAIKQSKELVSISYVPRGIDITLSSVPPTLITTTWTDST